MYIFKIVTDMSRNPNPEIIEKLKEILYKEIIDKGIDGISMRNIAKKAGVTATTIYYYYKDKNDLISKIKSEGFAKLSDSLINDDNSNEDILMRIEKFIRGFINWCLDNPNLTILLFEKLPSEFNLEPEILYNYEKPLHYLTDVINEGMRNKKIKKINALLTVNMGFCTAYGVAAMIITKRVSEEYWKNPGQIIDNAIKMLMDSIKNNE
jgi:AcrR family transcriptional regulator